MISPSQQCRHDTRRAMTLTARLRRNRAILRAKRRQQLQADAMATVLRMATGDTGAP